MSDEIKKYVDQAALNTFLGKLKEAYANNTASKFKVNYAATAGIANKVVGSITFDLGGGETRVWDGRGSITIPVSADAPAPSVEGVLKFKGLITEEGFPSGVTFEEGDVLVCTEDYTEGAGASAKTYHAGSEYLYVKTGLDGNDQPIYEWVELGSVVDTSNFVTRSDVEDIVNIALDPYITELEVQEIVDSLATKAELEDYVTESELSDTLQGYIEVGALDDYYDKAAVDAIVDTLATKTEVEEVIEEAVAPLATKEELTEAIEPLATKAELEEHKTEADDKYVHKVDYVTEPEVNKMFPVEFNGGTAEEFGNVLDGLASQGGGAVEIPDNTIVSVPTTGNYGYVVGTSSDPVDLKIDLGEGAKLQSTEGARVLSISPNSKVEIEGGEVVSSGSVGIFISNDSSLSIDGTTLESTGTGTVLQSNGLNENSDFIIKNATIKGSSYMPACGNLVIENSIIEATDVEGSDACAMYVKSGSVTIRNSQFIASDVWRSDISGPWKHSNNGCRGIATALVIENCNYGGHGNISVDIDAASTFTAGASTSDFDNVGILVINYNGNESDVLNIQQNFYEIDVTESTIANHYFTTDGRGGTEQMSLRVPN